MKENVTIKVTVGPNEKEKHVIRMIFGKN